MVEESHQLSSLFKTADREVTKTEFFVVQNRSSSDYSMFLWVIRVSKFTKMKDSEIFKACSFSFDFPISEVRFEVQTDPNENFERPKKIEVDMKMM